MEEATKMVMAEVDAAYKRGMEMGRAMAVSEMTRALLRVAQTETDVLTVEAPTHPVGCRCEVCR